MSISSRQGAKWCRAALTWVIWLAAAATTACGGGGGGGSGTGGNPEPAVSTPLFVTSWSTGTIARFPALNPPAGSTLTGEVIAMVDRLGLGLSYDAQNDRLYAVSGNAVVVFDSASTRSGNNTPTRVIQVTTAGLVFHYPTSVYLDKKNDVLYFGGNVGPDSHTVSGGGIAVIDHASTISGSVVPRQMLRFARPMTGFAVDPGRATMYVGLELYLGVFKNWEAATGILTPVAVFAPTSPSSWNGSSGGVSIDPVRDRLYFADVFTGLHYLNNASTFATGSTFGTVPLGLPAGVGLAGQLTIDPANDRLYLGAGRGAYIINAASAMTNGVVPKVNAVQAAADSTGFAFP